PDVRNLHTPLVLGPAQVPHLGPGAAAGLIGVAHDAARAVLAARRQPRTRHARRQRVGGRIVEDDHWHWKLLLRQANRADQPPSTGMIAPVTKEARSEARNAATSACSRACPARPSAAFEDNSRNTSGATVWLRSVSVNPWCEHVRANAP